MQAEPSLQATQMKLKRARLADDLNEKIAQRPGPMELVEKKILAVDSEAEKLNKGIYPLINVLWTHSQQGWMASHFTLIHSGLIDY